MELPPIIRLFPEAAPTGHNEDNGALLAMILQALPADLIQPVAAAARALNIAAKGVVPEQCCLPQVEYADALKSGNLPALRRYWAEDGATAGFNKAAKALAKSGGLVALQWLHNTSPGVLDTRGVYLTAALNAHVEILRWASLYGRIWEVSLCRAVAANALMAGHLEVLLWARTGCPQLCGNITVSLAAQHGPLHIVQWALAQGFTWDAHTCAWAAVNGRLATLQWLRAQDPPCPWDCEAILNATGNGHTEVAQWLRDNGCPEPP